MAHELTIRADGRAEMFYYGDEPWHGLGTKVDEALTAFEAIQAAGLDWEVEKQPIYYQNKEGLFVRANDVLDEQGRQMNVVVRQDNGLPLGVVGKDYQCFQNHEAFSFMDSVVMDASAKYHTAGSIRGGRIIWMLMKLPNPMIIGQADQVDKYILFMNKHDGTGKAIAKFTPTRVVCMNTLTVAIREASTTVAITHTGNLNEKVAKARKVLGLAVNYFNEFEQTAKALRETPINEETLDLYLTEVFEKDTEYAEGEKAMCTRLYHEGAGHEMGEGSLWGAYNSVTEYVDHHRLVVPELSSTMANDIDQYLNSVMVGNGAAIKSKAFTVAASLVG